MARTAFGATLVALFTFSPALAGEDSSSLVLSSDKILGAEVRLASGVKDEIQDLAFATESGRIHGVLLASGEILSFGQLVWMPAKARFAIRENPEPAEAPKGESMWLVSRVTGLDLHGVKDENRNQRTELAKVGGIFVEMHSGHVAFLVAPLGGVVGIGADSKVVPWSAVSVQRNKEGTPVLFTRLSPTRLAVAPQWGEAGEQLHNPEFRSRVYSFYGADKPEFDRSIDDGVGRVVTLEALIGSDVIFRGQNDEIDDILVHTESGKAAYAELTSGAVLPLSKLHWVPESRLYRTKVKKTESLENRAEYFRASRLADFTVRAADGEIGTAEDYWLDLTNRRVAYLSVTIGATLGLGGEVKVLPWSAVRVARRSGDEFVIAVPMSRKALEGAPALDGSVGSDIYNPAFRARVDAFVKDHPAIETARAE